MEKRKRDNNFLSNAYDQLVSICLLGNDIFSYILSKSTAESRQRSAVAVLGCQVTP